MSTKNWAVVEQSTEKHPEGRIVVVACTHREARDIAAGKWAIMPLDDIPESIQSVYFTSRWLLKVDKP